MQFTQECELHKLNLKGKIGMLNRTILGLALSVTFAACCIALNAQVSSQSNTLAVSISMQTTQVPIGQSPVVLLTIKNLTDNYASLPPDLYRVHVVGKNGEPPTTLFQRQITQQLRPGETDILRGGVTVDLPPSETKTDKFNLLYFYDLNVPGKYSVYLDVLDSSGKRKWLRTNTVQFVMLR